MSLQVVTDAAATSASIINPGYWGINVSDGLAFTGSLYARSASITSVTVLLKDNATTYATTTISGVGAAWKKFEFSLKCQGTGTAQFHLLWKTSGNKVDRINFDVVTLFPTLGWKGLPWMRPVSSRRAYHPSRAHQPMPLSSRTHRDHAALVYLCRRVRPHCSDDAMIVSCARLVSCADRVRGAAVCVIRPGRSRGDDASRVHPLPGRLLRGGADPGQPIQLEEGARPHRAPRRPLEPLGILVRGWTRPLRVPPGPSSRPPPPHVAPAVPAVITDVGGPTPCLLCCAVVH